MTKVIRIGTRDSELALWQAHTVKNKLEDLGYQTEIISVKSDGDLVLDKPLYEMGITGIFTKTLDVAMITGKVDIAVHSMKDVPTSLPVGIVKKAVLKRANVHDILVYKDSLDFLQTEAIIATGSLRRKAQWLHKFPEHKVENLRGNVNTRLQKLHENDWNGAIFAAAGLERIDKKPQNHIILDWMIPAPAQGAMVVVVNEKDAFSCAAVSKLNDLHTDVCTHIEREFLKTLEGGCTAPIGAFAQIKEGEILFEGALFSLDGRKKVYISEKTNENNFEEFGKKCAEKVLNSGGKEIMQELSNKGL
ncbi:hydroxymethylbilane synthase [Capnocytophaga cynodegmi]|uniref:Hydroxymethylbilane synthase n=1 Tax=Capnocytophaga cynodegmi TaxID=28189 RepID=A0A0B7HDV7_9FLAO|nr:hydroxymethylbilane synthase [Capnocytophaga cynodegmi]CEN37460.1 Pre-uroporphyrinogen synthase [Capnocytophaga cynodegmi]CEN39835.1 Pre-uroporphyrinogen synthase [Capnocytophaga cynodegmi]